MNPRATYVMFGEITLQNDIIRSIIAIPIITANILFQFVFVFPVTSCFLAITWYSFL